jgi:hypothetical protein
VTPRAELLGIDLPARSAPIPPGFGGQPAPAFRQQLLDVPVAQAEAAGQPHAMANHVRRKPLALGDMGGW